MKDLDHNSKRLIWRVAAGVLALLAIALAGLRIVVLAVQGPPPDTDELSLAFSILFPLSLGLLFGYFAIAGRIPGQGGNKS